MGRLLLAAFVLIEGVLSQLAWLQYIHYPLTSTVSASPSSHLSYNFAVLLRIRAYVAA
jgi:hypothetical protein